MKKHVLIGKMAVDMLFGHNTDRFVPTVADIIAELDRAEKMKALIHEMVNNKFTKTQ